MQTSLYSLPKWEFVGGASQNRSFTLLRESGIEYNLPESTASLAVVEFVNPRSTPILTKQCPVYTNADGTYCEVIFKLSPSDTVSMSGKYIYQITIKDVNGNTSIPQRGYMIVAENIDKGFVQ